MNEIRIESTGHFEAMDDKQLLFTYNQVCGGDDEVLPDRAVAIDRILKVLAARRKIPAPVKRPTKTGRPVGRPHLRFDLRPADRQMRPRAASTRGKILAMLLAGTTVQRIRADHNLSSRAAYNHVRQLHVECGWGIREDEAGNMQAFT